MTHEFMHPLREINITTGIACVAKRRTIFLPNETREIVLVA
jgi:hypothetical protein